MQRRLGLVALAILGTIAVEIAIFVWVAHLLGLVWAVTLVVALTVLGGWLLQREGIRGWRRFRTATSDGRPPGREATDGLVGLLGALLLATPGFVTSLIGALLMTPPGRGYARDRVERYTERWISPATAGNLFGPRRVRVRRGRPVRTPGPTIEPTSTGPLPPGPPTTPSGPSNAGPSNAGPPPGQPKAGPTAEVLEGEIIDLPRADQR